MGEIRVGTCGFCMPQAELFATLAAVEVQRSFYQLPQVKTVQRWREQAGDRFEFSLKAFQAITHTGSSPTYRRSKLNDREKWQCGHFRQTPVTRRAWRDTHELAAALSARFIIFQCPPGFEATDENVENMRRFFDRAKRDGVKLCFEPRNESWTTNFIRDACRESDLIHVTDPFNRKPVYGTPRYFRLHGGIKAPYRYQYKYQYSDDELKQLLDECTAAENYCMFNNAAMREDAQRFQRLVERS